jgi:hypothetical protein
MDEGMRVKPTRRAAKILAIASMACAVDDDTRERALSISRR